jgi:hypothetical protein
MQAASWTHTDHLSHRALDRACYLLSGQL